MKKMKIRATLVFEFYSYRDRFDPGVDVSGNKLLAVEKEQMLEHGELFDTIRDADDVHLKLEFVE